MMKLADACIEFLQETLEHYGEALNVYDRMMYEMNETFWQLYGVDMESVLAAQDPGSRDILPSPPPRPTCLRMNTIRAMEGNTKWNPTWALNKRFFGTVTEIKK